MFGMALGNPYFSVQGCVPVLLVNSMLCLALGLGFWVEFAFSVGMEILG